MQLSPSQFIGVTGFTKPAQVCVIQNEFGRDEPLLMAGVMADSSQFKMGPSTQPTRFPQLHRLKDILSALDPDRSIGLVRYVAHEPRLLALQCRGIIQRGNLRDSPVRGRFDGFVFTAKYPSPDLLWVTVTECGHLYDINRDHPWAPKNVLTVNVADIDMLPSAFYAEIMKYFDADTNSFPFSYVSIEVDENGSGVVDWSRAREYLSALAPLMSEPYGLHLCIGGDLTDKNMDGLRPIVDAHPQISLSAGHKLMGDDQLLDLDAVRRYIDAAKLLLSGE